MANILQLQNSGLRWLAQHDKVTKPFVQTTKATRLAWIAACDQCSSCDRRWCFSQRSDSQGAWLDVEAVGSCAGGPNLKRRKLELAKEYGCRQGLTYGKAIKAMDVAGIPPAEWPSEEQVKQQRKAAKGTSKHYSSVCIGALQHFLRQPPGNLRVFEERCVCEDQCVRIPFASVEALAWFEQCRLTSFLLDFTFSTNAEGLLLGGAGPVGLYVGEDGLPHMRFVPVIMVLSHSEDDAARTLALDLLFSLRSPDAPAFTDGFADCSCFEAAVKFCGERVYLHRCLEHTKKNLKGAAAAKDEAGLPRLRRTELRPLLLEWLMFSSWLPSDIEFDVFWRSILERMRNSRCATDFREPAMAEYIASHILDAGGPLLRAPWASGLGCVPLGYTTYAPNAIEATWRVIKGLLDDGYKFRSSGALMVDVVNALQSRIRLGAYSNLQDAVTSVLPCLVEWPDKKAAARRDTRTEDMMRQGEDSAQHGRLDVKALLRHYRENGREQTFLETECDVLLSTGQRAVRCYTMAKYKPHLASTRREDMLCAQQLALATTADGVRAAAAHKTERVYDIVRHIYLRQTFVSVFLLEGGQAVDQHRHFIEAGGQSEHSIFFAGLADPSVFNLQAFAQGPRNSRPHQPKHKPKATRSAALKRMLGPPEHDAAIVGLRDVATDARGSADAAPDAGAQEDRSADAAPDAAPAAPAMDAAKCVARRWDGGKLTQCTHRRTCGEFCGIHRHRQPHGRVDEALAADPAPPEVAPCTPGAAPDVAAPSAPEAAPSTLGAASDVANATADVAARRRAPVGHPLSLAVRRPRGIQISQPAPAEDQLCLAGEDMLQMPANFRFRAKRGDANVHVRPGMGSD